MAKTIAGLFETSERAHLVVQQLTDSGFDRNQIGLMTSDRGNIPSGTNEIASGDTASAAMKGAGAGAAMGGVAGLVAGIAALAIPGIGPVVAAGPLATILAGVGIGAAAGGGIGALTHMGIPEEDAQYYAEGVRRGNTLVTVAVTDEDSAEQAIDIMRSNEAINIDEKAREWQASSAQGVESTGVESTQEEVLPVVKEELVVGKRQVERGGVRVYSHTTETPVEETVHLHGERTEIERRPVDRPLEAGEHTSGLGERTVEVRETMEEPVVSKQARVVEEVIVTKEAIERDATIRDTLKQTEVDVERIPSGARKIYQGVERRLASSNSRYNGVERRATA